MEKKRYHVLFIQVDQWGEKFLDFTGNNTIMTPTIHQLARDGVMYSNCYSTCPVCIPARRSLMTGLFPKTHKDRVYSDRMKMPAVTTLAEAFYQAGYHTMAVGKLHVYPQRNRIGFQDVILQEEGRYEFGGPDDYQIWLGENGYIGQEFLHGMGNNTYYTRTWPLSETAHPTTWATGQMIKQIKRRDPEKPAFFYLSYTFPHPPLVPLSEYWDMYSEQDIQEPEYGDWEDESFIFKELTEAARYYSHKEMIRAKRAYYAQCTHIDNQIRLVIGALKEEGILDDTILVFTSDHGEMLFDHGMVGKRTFYENSAHIPLIFSGNPVSELRGKVDDRIACLEDIMPTLLELCKIEIPSSVEGQSLFEKERRDFLYGEISEGYRATRMIRMGNYKLIYYPYGNKVQIFDILQDKNELHDLSKKEKFKSIKEEMLARLCASLYGKDRKEWIRNGKLVGVEAPAYKERGDYTFSNQRGLHWPI